MTSWSSSIMRSHFFMFFEHSRKVSRHNQSYSGQKSEKNNRFLSCFESSKNSYKAYTRLCVPDMRPSMVLANRYHYQICA